MSLNIQLTPIFKYLHQVRKIEDYLIFDMYFPNSWKILKKFVKNFFMIKDNTIKIRLQ